MNFQIDVEDESDKHDEEVIQDVSFSKIDNDAEVSGTIICNKLSDPKFNYHCFSMTDTILKCVTSTGKGWTEAINFSSWLF